MRAGELARLAWKDIDLERKTLTLNHPEKRGTPRMFNISSKLATMLATLPRTNEYVFGTPSKLARTVTFYLQRKKLARKLGNPRLLDIHLHTLRHWKATMLYHETKNPQLVKEFLGHSSLDVTSLYIHLDKVLFKESNDSFAVKAVRNVDEIASLLETGFEYHCEKDGMMFFRKRK